MLLKELQSHWDRFGKIDAMGAILTEPDKVGGNWEPDEFFRKGVEEIAAVMDDVRGLGVELKRREALDFGCGVGRLTQALCGHFERAHGVDIAPSMIQLANRYNRHGDRCRYHLNEVNDLTLFDGGRFDFIYSNLVLQHMRPEYARVYIAEFLRVLAPGGLAIFQLPSVRGDVATQSQPLPPEGFRASVTLLESPGSLNVGDKATVRVRLRNESECTWPCWWDAHGRYQVTLGNHWFTSNGDLIVADDARSGLSHDMKPGDEVELALRITAPSTPGTHVLEVDAVQEQHCWFAQRGSAPARVAVRVKQPAYRKLSDIFKKAGTSLGIGTGAPSNETPGDHPVMEMYGIEQSEVVELLGHHGGIVVDVRTTVTPDWVHARYFVSK